MGAPLIAVVLGVAGANARFMPMTLSMIPVFQIHLIIENGIISFHIFFHQHLGGNAPPRREIRADRRVFYFLGFSLPVCLPVS
ncbi:MAG: hypothetical protein Ct9H300mP28_30770 [Pseudomonadota bacterium]|nr:MAG: hypothetical protein Ct9H300mP28_30770 [Pseudomonadota bacterium]